MSEKGNGIQVVTVEGGGTPYSALLNVLADDDLLIICYISGGCYYELRIKEHEAFKLAERLHECLPSVVVT